MFSNSAIILFLSIVADLIVSSDSKDLVLLVKDTKNASIKEVKNEEVMKFHYNGERNGDYKICI